jgi:sulfur-oxidizing protein SoxX
MLHRSKVLALATLLSASVACNSGRYSSAGFHLPADGNVERGKVAFVALECQSCHPMPGADLPAPTVQPPVPVTLGGEVAKRLSDAYIVTSMLDPSYQLAPYPKDQITTEGHSRMPNYTDKMTGRQMIDIVAFLQSHYTIRPAPPAPVYH